MRTVEKVHRKETKSQITILYKRNWDEEEEETVPKRKTSGRNDQTNEAKQYDKIARSAWRTAED